MNNKIKIFLGSDHAGFKAKLKVISILDNLGYFNYLDLGTFSEEFSVDYPDIAKMVSKSVLNQRDSFGILICGSGAGMQIAANRFKGIRAVFCFDEYSARMARLDNDANILTLRAREFSYENYEKIVEFFLGTNFSNLDRHIRRIKKLDNLDD